KTDRNCRRHFKKNLKSRPRRGLLFDFHMTIAFLVSQVRVTVCKDCSDCKESKSGYSGNTEQHCQQIFAFNRSNKCPNTNNEEIGRASCREIVYVLRGEGRDSEK